MYTMKDDVLKAEKSECIGSWQFFWKNPYLMRLVFSVGMGALIFGYDTGAMSRAFPYIHEKQAQSGVEVAMLFLTTFSSLFAMMGAVSGAIMSNAYDGHTPKSMLLRADVFFMMGAFVSILHIKVISLGRIFVGIGMGMASMSSPRYISEASPTRIRGALVSTISLLAAVGHLLSYPTCLLASKAPGTWRWMLGVTGVLAVVHFRLVQSLPESPLWLYRKDEIKEAVEIIKKLHPPHEVENEVKSLELSVEAEIAEEGSLYKNYDHTDALRNFVALRGICIVFCCQVAQQLLGITMVMFYSPMILRLGGYTSDNNMTTTKLPLITCSLSAIGCIISILFVDRVGRRRLLLISMLGCIACLGLLSNVFYEAATLNSQGSSSNRMIEIDPLNVTCPVIINKTNKLYIVLLNCMTCSKLESDSCHYTHPGYSFDPGMCVTELSIASCHAKDDEEWYNKGGSSTSLRLCASVGLGLYIIFYSLGMETVPMVINSEIYPFRFRGICAGEGAFFSWGLSVIMSLASLKLDKEFGSAHVFRLLCLVSTIAALFIYLFLPETKGLRIEEIDGDVVFIRNGSDKRRDDLVDKWDAATQAQKALRMSLLV